MVEVKEWNDGSNIYTRKILLLHSDKSEGGNFDTIPKINGMVNTCYYIDDYGKGFKSQVYSMV